jgi:hypothetical protein
MRSLIFVVPVLALAACDPAVPNSGTGVGFGDYQTYLAQREAELSGQRPAQVQSQTQAQTQTNTAVGAPLSAVNPAVMAAAPVAAAPLADPATSAAVGDGALGAEALAALAATAPGGSPAMASTTPTAAPVAAPVIAPVQGATGPNLAAYALAATNAPGQSVYTRSGLHMVGADKACAKYISPDLAQMAFLEKGGPQKDPGNLDPDGDGFACGWDPRPLQTALQ